MPDLSILFARNTHGKVVHVNDVPRGAACSCTCIECGETLLSRQGVQRMWHFAHIGNSSCGGGGAETVLHLRAKQLLLDCPWVDLGAVLSPIELSPECTYPDSAFRCDVGKPGVYAEVVVHHNLDEAKLRYIANLDGWVFRISLTDLVGMELSEAQLKSEMSGRWEIVQRPLEKRRLESPKINNSRSKRKIKWNLDPSDPVTDSWFGQDRTKQICRSDGLLWWRASTGFWWFLIPEGWAARVYLPDDWNGSPTERLYVVYLDLTGTRTQATTHGNSWTRQLHAHPQAKPIMDCLERIRNRRAPLYSREECLAMIKSALMCKGE